MKGFFYRLRGTPKQDEPESDNEFTVTIGELREQLGKKSDPKTDGLKLRVGYEVKDDKND